MKSTIQPGRGSDFDIAIIGMAGRFPQANSVAEFWENLLQGKDCINRETPLLAREEGCEIVRAFGALDRPFHFDPEFFEVSPQDAQGMEPQERILLHCAYEALEDAGCDFEKYPGKIGIVCGAPENEYYLEDRFKNKRNNPLLVETEKITQAGTSLCSRISYKLNLTGPSLIVGTACATSLSAVHLGARMLLNYDADIMLAGGANVSLNQNYYYPIEGMISREGVVRAFDNKGRGLVPGNGVGLVVLKRLREAVLEGDNIYAVIKGSAIGNDGRRKIGFAAPSPQGEYQVIREALDFARLEEKEIDYIETHGTGTPLGDAVEIRALNRIFAGKVPAASLPIGSLKSNCGHLNFAAGIAGLIKAALLLKHGMIPPSLHHEEDNEELNPASPLYVVKKPLKLARLERKRHAGVSAFGVGGANAHVILEEYREEAGAARAEEREELWVLSGKSPQALSENLARHEDSLSRRTVNLQRAAYTLLTGRQHYEHRNYLVVKEGETVKTGKPYHLREGEKEKKPEIIFLFPGTGSDYEGMGRDLYQKCEIFRRHCREGNEILSTLTGRQVDLLSTREKTLTAAKLLTCSYSLGRTLMAAGITPAKLIGHSLGEYTLAALGGVITLEEALGLVYARARLIDRLPGGKLISVAADRQRVEGLLGQGVYTAAVNAPGNFLLVCLEEDFPGLERRLKEGGYRYVLLNSDMPAHSPMMAGIAGEYEAILSEIPFRPGKLPMVSSYLGREVSREELARPGYWLEQMIHPVNFSGAIQQVLAASEERKVFLEVGPGNQLTSLVKRNLHRPGSAFLWDILRPGKEEAKEWRGLLTVLGELWKMGWELDLADFYPAGQRKKVSLPPYSFQLREFNALKAAGRGEGGQEAAEEREPEGEGAEPPRGTFTYELRWAEKQPDREALREKAVLVLEEGSPVREALGKKRAAFARVLSVSDWTAWAEQEAGEELAVPGAKLKILFAYRRNPEELTALLAALQGLPGEAEVYVASASPAAPAPEDSLAPLYGICDYYNSLSARLKVFSVDSDGDLASPPDSRENAYLVRELLYNREDFLVVYRRGRRLLRTKGRDLKPRAAEGPGVLVSLNPGLGPEVCDYVRETIPLDFRAAAGERDSALVVTPGDFSYFKELERRQDEADGISSLRDYPGLNETYGQLCLSGAAAYFRRQGVVCRVPYAIPQLLRDWEVREEYRDFVFFLMNLLAREGYAEMEGEGIVFLSKLEGIEDLEAQCQKACREQPLFAPYIQLFYTCASSYDQVFRGRVEGNSILYPGGNYDFLNSVDEQIPSLERTWTYIRILPSLVRHLTGKSKGRIRILEVGGGTGLITWPLLEALPAEQVEYYFTDIGPSFVAQAEGEARRRGYAQVRFAAFNVEKDYREAGFFREQFDLIVGFDVLQATSNLKGVLANLYGLLKDNGLMIMLQSFWLHDIVTMIYGFAPGWWNFQKDEERRGTALAFPASRWEYFFRSSGLTNIYTVSGGRDGSRNEAGLILGNKLSPAQPGISRSGLGDYLEGYAQGILALSLEDLKEESRAGTLYAALAELNERYEAGKDLTVLLPEPEGCEDYGAAEALLSYLEDLAYRGSCRWRLAFYAKDNLPAILAECMERYQSPLTITRREKSLPELNPSETEAAELNLSARGTSGLGLSEKGSLSFSVRESAGLSPGTNGPLRKGIKESSPPEVPGSSLAEAEGEIIALVQEIVGEKNIRGEDDLYDIGIDSLSILIIKAKLQKSCRCDLSVKEIFACGTIRKFAALVDRRRGELSPGEQQVPPELQGHPRSETQADPRPGSLADLFEKVKAEAGRV